MSDEKRYRWTRTIVVEGDADAVQTIQARSLVADRDDQRHFRGVSITCTENVWAEHDARQHPTKQWVSRATPLVLGKHAEAAKHRP